MKIIDVTLENFVQETFFCIRNTKDPGFIAKQEWFNLRYNEGLRLKILKNDTNMPIAFIEYIPAEYAWRPVDANRSMIINVC